MAATVDVPGHRGHGDYHLVPLPPAAYASGETHGTAAGTGVLGAESGVVGERVCELCRHRAQVFAAGGHCAEWVEDAGDVWDCRGCDSGELCGVFGYGG